jgi:hypothetical protein
MNTKNLMAMGALCAAMCATLGACGGGSGDAPGSAAPPALPVGGGGGGTPPAAPGPDAPAPTPGTPASSGQAIHGIVAQGLPLVGAHISVVDSTGKACLVTDVVTDRSGYYEADTSRCVPPMVVTATSLGPEVVAGVPYTWESISVTNNDIINISPLTTMVSTLAVGGVPTTVFETPTLKSTPAQLSQKLKAAQAALQVTFEQSGIAMPSGFDFIHSPFAANGSGIDAILDGISVTQDRKTGAITVRDKTGKVELFAIEAATGAITTPAGAPTVWPDYWVFNGLSTGTPRELGSAAAVNADDTAVYAAATGATGTLVFKNHTHPAIDVLRGYDTATGGIAALAGQTGNERLHAQVVALCTNGNAYALLSKAATIVPLSELTNGGTIMMEQLGVSEDCPLARGVVAPVSFQFAGDGGPVKTPNGSLRAAEFLDVNGSGPGGEAGYDRFLAFKVSVNGLTRYGLIERGLDQDHGQAPFMYLHIQR